MRRALLVLLCIASLSAPAAAGPCGDLCAAVEDGLRRPGVSHADLTGAEIADIDIADFYFAPRLAEVRDGQTVRFTNTARAGGSRHSVASADWGGDEPVLPVPVASFGGGHAFRSERLQPGSAFVLEIDIATMEPAGTIPLPGGDVLVAYFCYIHGASQMNGQLLVRR